MMGSYSISIHKFGDGIKFTKIQILLIPSKLPFLSLSRGVYSSIGGVIDTPENSLFVAS